MLEIELAGRHKEYWLSQRNPANLCSLRFYQYLEQSADCCYFMSLRTLRLMLRYLHSRLYFKRNMVTRLKLWRIFKLLNKIVYQNLIRELILFQRNTYTYGKYIGNSLYTTFFYKMYSLDWKPRKYSLYKMLQTLSLENHSILAILAINET